MQSKTCATSRFQEVNGEEDLPQIHFPKSACEDQNRDELPNVIPSPSPFSESASTEWQDEDVDMDIEHETATSSGTQESMLSFDCPKTPPQNVRVPSSPHFLNTPPGSPTPMTPRPVGTPAKSPLTVGRSPRSPRAPQNRAVRRRLSYSPHTPEQLSSPPERAVRRRILLFTAHSTWIASPPQCPGGS